MQRVGDFYASAMDSTARNKLGYEPIKAQLQELNNLTTKQQVINEIAIMRTEGYGAPLFGFYVGQDAKNATRYMAQLGQGGTSLPDRDYYLKNDPTSVAVRTAYLSYMKDLFVMTGDKPEVASKKADEIMGLETGLAKLQMSRVEMRDPIKRYNKFSVSDFTKMTPGLDWKSLLIAMKVPNQDSILVSNPDFLKGADALLSAVPLDTWKAYLQWSVIKSTANYLSDDFVNRSFVFSQVLSGQKEIEPRWQRATTLSDRAIGELIGQLYVDKYFTPAAKARMLNLVENIQQTFGERIKRLDWMSEATKKQALIKLKAIVNKIGFPDKWETYPGVVINRNDFFGNMKSIGEFGYNKMVNWMGKPVDKTLWGMTPPTINVHYT